MIRAPKPQIFKDLASKMPPPPPPRALSSNLSPEMVFGSESLGRRRRRNRSVKLQTESPIHTLFTSTSLSRQPAGGRLVDAGFIEAKVMLLKTIVLMS
jgi:hypothetical protein